METECQTIPLPSAEKEVQANLKGGDDKKMQTQITFFKNTQDQASQTSNYLQIMKQLKQKQSKEISSLGSIDNNDEEEKDPEIEEMNEMVDESFFTSVDYQKLQNNTNNSHNNKMEIKIQDEQGEMIQNSGQIFNLKAVIKEQIDLIHELFEKVKQPPFLQNEKDEQSSALSLQVKSKNNNKKGTQNSNYLVEKFKGILEKYESATGSPKEKYQTKQIKTFDRKDQNQEIKLFSQSKPAINIFSNEQGSNQKKQQKFSVRASQRHIETNPNQKINQFQDNSLSIATTTNLPRAPSYQYLATTRNKKRIWATQNSNANDATKMQSQIIQKINSVSPSKVNPQFSKQQCLKIISSIYIEKLKQLKGTDKQTPLHILIYEFFLFKHGLKRIAESKLLQFLESLIQYSLGSQRISFFLSLFKEQDSTTDFEQFMHFAMHLDNAETLLGSEGLLVETIKISSALTKVYSEMFQKNFSVVMKTQTWNELQNELENQANEKIEFDSLGPKIVELNHELSSQAVEKLKEVYLAGDVDDDGSIGWDEFIMLVRHMEPRKFSLLAAAELYLSNCDQLVEETNERTMTFEKFSLLAKENDLFSKKSRVSFALADKEIEKLSVLKKHWNDKKALFMSKFEQAQCFTKFFSNLIQKIDEYFIQSEASKLNEITIWFIYRFLTEESKRVILEAQVNNLLIQEFILIYDNPLQILQQKFQRFQ